MRPHKGAAALLLLAVALALPACGTQDAELGAARSAKIPLADLGVMVLPQEELDPLAAGLRISADGSGPTNNADAAADTLDPGDTAKSLSGKGRIGGYELVYEQPNAAAAKRTGLLSVGTGVELFRDAVYATQHVSKQVGDYDRFEGQTLEGIKLARVTSFDAGAVGEEAHGVEVTAVAGKLRVHITAVYFSRGRLAATAWALRTDGRALADEVSRLALTLDSRIQRVLAGQLDEEAVALPGKPRTIDPKPFVLTLADLPPGTAATGEGRRQHGDIASFLREFVPPDNQLGGSTVLYLRSMVQVSERRREAAALLRAIESRKVALTLARTFVQGVVESKVTRLRVLPLEVDGRDTAGAIFRFDLGGEPIETVFFYVWSGRLLGSVTALGPAGKIRPADVLTLVPRVRARLNTGG